MVRELSWEQKESQSPLLTRCTGCTAGRAKNTKDGKLLPTLNHQPQPLTGAPHQVPHTAADKAQQPAVTGEVELGCAGAGEAAH